MTFSFLLLIVSLQKTDKQTNQEFFFVKWEYFPLKNLYYDLIFKTHQKANRIKDDTELSDFLSTNKIIMCLKQKKI